MDKKIDKIYNSLSAVEKDALYRKLWMDYVKKDVHSLLEDDSLEDNKDVSVEDIADIVSERYVHDGDYDCNLSYWDNLENLVSEVQEELDKPEMEL